MSSSDDISLSRHFKTILNETRISFHRNTKDSCLNLPACNPSLAIMFAGLLFQYGAGNCERVYCAYALAKVKRAMLGAGAQWHKMAGIYGRVFDERTEIILLSFCCLYFLLFRFKSKDSLFLVSSFPLLRYRFSI